MKMSWYTHDPLDTDTANELLSRYASRNIQTRKAIATDPRLWLVSALLPEGNHPPKKDTRYEHRCWS